MDRAPTSEPSLFSTKPPEPVPYNQSPIPELVVISVPSMLNPPFGGSTGAVPGPICANKLDEQIKNIVRIVAFSRNVIFFMALQFRLDTIM